MNVNAANGQARVQVLDGKSGEALPGLSFADCQPITSDGLHEAVQWRGGGLASAAGKTIQLEFELTRADLFAFEFN